jgi:nucleoid DNA-binding protein
MSRKRGRPADDRLTAQSGAGLTKSGLTDQVYKRHGGLTKNEAAGIVEKIFDTLKTNLSDGRPVKIQNFGVFEVVPRQGRTGVNPANGKKIFIPPHKGLSFRPSPRLRDAVDESDDES